MPPAAGTAAAEEEEEGGENAEAYETLRGSSCFVELLFLLRAWGPMLGPPPGLRAVSADVLEQALVEPPAYSRYLADLVYRLSLPLPDEEGAKGLTAQAPELVADDLWREALVSCWRANHQPEGAPDVCWDSLDASAKVSYS